MSAEGDNRHEIVIVRRRGGHDDEGHHSAAWKIAYADFMTAMMAFFLVMWLVNAASKKQIVEVAAYFNPIKLTDKVTAPKGVHKADLNESNEVPTDKMANPQKEGAGKQASKSEADKKGSAPGQEHSNPSKATAAEREGHNAGSAAGTPDAENGSRLQDAANDEMFRHPFEILKRLEGEADGRLHDAAQALTGLDQSVDFSKDPFELTGRHTASAEAVPNPSAKAEASKEAADIKAPKPTGPAAPPPLEPGDRLDGQKLPVPSKEPGSGKKLEAQVQAIIEAHKPEGLPELEVTRTQEGVLISLAATGACPPDERYRQAPRRRARSDRHSRPYRCARLSQRELRQLAAFNLARPFGLLHAGQGRSRRKADRSCRRLCRPSSQDAG